jgi:A/G-specific adenine glycosylase
MPKSFADLLLAWFEENARVLPWRERASPYHIWISEIMLQQTRVETVIPYYRAWMARFPDMERLAKAPRQEVLRLWEGLGYYRRAHQLHETAQLLVEQYNCELPKDERALMDLPGIGPYSAAAIRAMAFDQDAIAMDGNLRRVLSRIVDLDVDQRTRMGQERLRGWARSALPSGQASAFNQALMDLGSSVCTPQAPRCSECPISRFCKAYQHGVQEERPVSSRGRNIPSYESAAAVIRRDGGVLIARRPQQGLLGGLWAFPGGRLNSGEAPSSGLKRFLHDELALQVGVGEKVDEIQHAYTHFRITMHAFECNLISGEPLARRYDDFCWTPLVELANFPMGKVDRTIAHRICDES